MPTGDETADMLHIREYYKNVTPRFPEKFHKNF